MQENNYLDSLTISERLFREGEEFSTRFCSQDLQAFLRDGVVLFQDAIDPALIMEFVQDLNELAHDPQSHEAITIDGRPEHFATRFLQNLAQSDFRHESSGFRLCDLHQHFQRAQDLAMSSAITTLLSEFFGAPAALLQSLTFWKGTEQGLHQDFSYVNSHSQLAHLAAAWIPLEDVDPASGPLVYYKGSHLLNSEDFYDWGNNSIVHSRSNHGAESGGPTYDEYICQFISQNGLEPTIYLPKMGDLLIWHGALIHGGTPRKNSHLTRKSFVCHYTSAASHPSFQEHMVGGGVCFNNIHRKVDMTTESAPASVLQRAKGRARRAWTHLFP